MPSGSWLPEEVKEKLFNGAVKFVSKIAQRVAGDRISDVIRKLSADGRFDSEFRIAMQTATRRFTEQYSIEDAEVVQLLAQDDSFWETPSMLDALQRLVKRPGAYLPTDRETVEQEFSDVLPTVERVRVRRAVAFLLRCLAEELWHIPSLHPIYQLQLQRISVEQAQSMITELRGLREDTQLALQGLLPAVKERALIAAAAHSEPLIRHNLPMPSYGKFVGRGEELGKAIGYLRPYPHSQYALLTIDGPGGAGKTTLALEIGHFYVRRAVDELGPEDFEAIVWSCAKQTVLTASGIVSRHQSLRNLADLYSDIAAVFARPDLEAASPDEQHKLAASIIAQRRTLLIIDNLETVDDPQLLTFIRELPAPTKCIVTTRHRLDGAIPIRLSGLPPDDAKTLVLQQAANHELHISDTNAAALASATAGIPLAIVWTVGQMAYGKSLESSIQRLRSVSGDYARFCFNDAVSLISATDRNALVLLDSLAYFADGATREAVGYVAGFAEARTVRDDGLADLTRVSLINYDGRRFSVLPLTKEYVLAELARDRARETDTTDRFLSWHIQLANQASGGRLDLDASVLEALRLEHRNILWALDMSFRHERFTEFVKLVRGMEFFWLGAGYWSEYELYLTKGKTLAPHAVDRIHFALRLAWLDILKEDFAAADLELRSANLMLRDAPNPYEQMRADDFGGQLALETGDFARAEELLNRSLEQARTLGDRRGQFACLKYLGELACRQGRPDIARQRLQAAEPLAAGSGQDQWVRGLAHAEHLRGLIALAEERTSDAVTGFERCLEYLEIWPDERLATKARDGLAIALITLGEAQRASELLNQNLETLTRLNMRPAVKRLRSRIGGMSESGETNI